MMKKINNYVVESFYCGMTQYVVSKNGIELYNGFSLNEIIERFGFNIDDLL